MQQITPHRLWLGHAGDGRDFRGMNEAGIRALVQLAMEEPALQPPREMLYCRFPLLDGGGNAIETLTLAIGTVVHLLTSRVPTLVCCGGGMSRAPAIAAAALAVADRRTPEECLRDIAEQHPSDVSGVLWLDITGVLATARFTTAGPC